MTHLQLPKDPKKRKRRIYKENARQKNLLITKFRK